MQYFVVNHQVGANCVSTLYAPGKTFDHILSALGYGNNTDIPWSLLKRLKSLTVKVNPERSFLSLLPLWMNGVTAQEFGRDIVCSSIERHLHSPCEVALKHLKLCDLTTIPMVCSFDATYPGNRAHPIFWLWRVCVMHRFLISIFRLHSSILKCRRALSVSSTQIPNLESCELGVRLPKDYDFGSEFGSEFDYQCSMMLGRPEIRSASEKQISLKSLKLNIENLTGEFDWNSIFTNIRSMYPNLQEIAYNILLVPAPGHWWSDFVVSEIKITGSIDWKTSFGGLRHIELGIGIDIEAATELVTTMNDNNQVLPDCEVFLLNRVVISKMEADKIDDGWFRFPYEQYVDHCDMKAFMEAIDIFLKRNCCKLASFAVMFQLETCDILPTCRLLEDENGHWRPFSTFFRTVLSALDDDNAPDKYLDMNIEFGFRQTARFGVRNEIEDEFFWKKIQNRRRNAVKDKLYEEESRGSVDIAQLMCAIYDKVKANQREDKLVVKCSGIELSDNCREFIKFWFNDKDILAQKRSNFIWFIAQ